MRKNKLLLLLVLLVAVVSGAVAQTETLLTTITPTAKEQASYSTANVATVSFSYTAGGSSAYLANWGWWGYGWSATVTAAEGYTITKCIFYDDANRTATDSEAPFVVETTEEDKTPRINGTPIDGGNMWSKGIKKIEVYGYATYSVTLAEGTEDADKWTIEPNTGLKGGETVTVKYNGSREVKSVTVVKKAAVNPNAYMKWNADQKKLVATEIPAEVTTVANADAGVNWTAGTYVVEGNVEINGSITLNGNVDLIIKDGAKLTAQKISGGSNNLSIYGQTQGTGELVVHCSDGIAISELSTLEVHSAKVTATSSANYSGSLKITTFNVYGGSVDAQATGANGYGINLNAGGSMKIYGDGGDVKAVGKGVYYGIYSNASTTVTVYGGKLWAEDADNRALFRVTLTKGGDFAGKIEYSSDKSTWYDGVNADVPYVRVGY